jgi:hypothetical protein
LAVNRLALALLTACLAVSCTGHRPSIKHPEIPETVTTLTLVSQYAIPAGTRLPPVMGLPFGGVSGLTSRDAGREILGISDAQQGGRIYQFALEDLEATLQVAMLSAVPLAMAPGDEHPDPEGIALLHDGNFAVSAEGTDQEPRLPPSVNIYGRYGDFVRSLTIPDKFMPEPRGPQTKGARGNAGFESLTLTPDGSRLFTAAETALVQDGEAATFEAGAATRVLELVARRGTFAPAREFVYQLEPVAKPPYTPGFFINGLVDLLAINENLLLTLERGYVENAQNPGRSRSTIRVFSVDLTDATDVSGLESLKFSGGHPEVVALKKTLVLDLSKVQGLSKELATELDNFEGLTFGPRLPDGRASLVLVSDDNFSAEQRTWFLVFAIQ